MLVLLAVGVLCFAMTSIGLLVSKDLYDQIHYLAPGSIVGSIAVVLAVLVLEGLSQSGAKAILIASLLLFSNPVLSHATARAARVRRNQQVLPKPGENVPVAKERQ
ncbi:MAG: monovalent cation/H(+) antiporter subunit G [Bryobacteraceae bacterium]